METGTTLTDFLAMVTQMVATVKAGIGIMMEPPIVWYVALGFLGAAVGLAKRLVPRKKAKG